MCSWAPAQMLNTPTIEKISLAHCCSSAKFRRWLISKSFCQSLRQFLDHNFTFSWTKTCTLVNFAKKIKILDLKTALGANIWNTHLWIAASSYSKSVFPTRLVYYIRFWVRSTLAMSHVASRKANAAVCLLHIMSDCQALVNASAWLQQWWSSSQCDS